MNNTTKIIIGGVVLIGIGNYFVKKVIKGVKEVKEELVNDLSRELEKEMKPYFEHLENEIEKAFNEA